jgi:hypothetical protein
VSPNQKKGSPDSVTRKRRFSLAFSLGSDCAEEGRLVKGKQPATPPASTAQERLGPSSSFIGIYAETGSVNEIVTLRTVWSGRIIERAQQVKAI